jgi:hypothetical protein
MAFCQHPTSGVSAIFADAELVAKSHSLADQYRANDRAGKFMRGGRPVANHHVSATVYAACDLTDTLRTALSRT